MAGNFIFHECVSMVQPTGKSASTLDELLALIKEVDASVIYHHTHQYYLKASVESPEYPHDFSVWAAECLSDRSLAEKLACVDLYGLNDLEAIRQSLIETIEEYLKEFPSPAPCLPGEEFFFDNSVVLVVPTAYEVGTVETFCGALEQVGTSSVYFHFFESRLRLGHGEDDISHWLSEIGRKDLAQKVQALDPYFHSLEELRAKLLVILCGYDPEED